MWTFFEWLLTRPHNSGWLYPRVCCRVSQCFTVFQRFVAEFAYCCKIKAEEEATAALSAMLGLGKPKAGGPHRAGRAGKPWKNQWKWGILVHKYQIITWKTRYHKPSFTNHIFGGSGNIWSHGWSWHSQQWHNHLTASELSRMDDTPITYQQEWEYDVPSGKLT